MSSSSLRFPLLRVCLALALPGLISLLFPAGTVASPASDPNQNWLEVRSPHFTVATNASAKDGRHIASQFEQMRAMFHSAFPTFRVDTSQPIYIIAAKNEGAMKLLMPDEWAVKGHVHPSGMYQPGEDKDYVVMQADAQGSNPFHVIYHEYTHALLHLIAFDEPFGYSVVAAMACGTPVIAFRRGSMPELIDDGTTGFLVDDVEEAVDAVGRAGTVDRPRIRELAVARFARERMVDAYLDAYAAAIRGRR